MPNGILYENILYTYSFEGSKNCIPILVKATQNYSTSFILHSYYIHTSAIQALYQRYTNTIPTLPQRYKLYKTQDFVLPVTIIQSGITGK
jgi:hypothetical protein